MLKKNKNILIYLSIGIILIVSMFFVFNKKAEYKELPRVKLKEQSNTKQFALMLEQTKGEGDYKESNNNDLPLGGYKFNKEKSGCTDVNGKVVEDALGYDYDTYTVMLNTNKTVYCYLYYDKDNVINYLRSTDTEKYLSQDQVGDMFRYQGVFPDSDSGAMTNWLCFGTTDNCGVNNDLIDKYMYRIIGVTEDGKMKLIKETYIKEDNNTRFAKNNKCSIDPTVSYYCDNGKCPEWNDNLLFKRLNGISNGTTPGNGSYNNNANTDIFIDSAQYEYLRSGDSNGGESPSIWYKLIEETDWMYGDTTNSIKLNGNEMYKIETGDPENGQTTHYVGSNENVIEQTYTWTGKITAKIGLQYIYDYLYATPGGNPMLGTTAKNAWIHLRKDGFNTTPGWELIVTNYGIYKENKPNNQSLLFGSYDISQNGNINQSGTSGVIDGGGVRPVFYLTSNIELTGAGTKESPYIIKI